MNATAEIFNEFEKADYRVSQFYNTRIGQWHLHFTKLESKKKGKQVKANIQSGMPFDRAFSAAKILCGQTGQSVRLVFNGALCIVGPKSNYKRAWKNYQIKLSKLSSIQHGSDR